MPIRFLALPSSNLANSHTFLTISVDEVIVIQFEIASQRLAFNPSQEVEKGRSEVA